MKDEFTLKVLGALSHKFKESANKANTIYKDTTQSEVIRVAALGAGTALVLAASCIEDAVEEALKDDQSLS